jgi:polysaccharide export outer membrane protein
MTKFVSLLALVAILSGSASLPSSGPSADDLVQQSRTGDVQNYAVLDVTQEVVDILSARPADNLLANFGNYRPSIDPGIGIGDTLSVTVWEAAAGGLFSAPLLTDRFSTGLKSATIPEQVVGRDGSISVPYAGRIRVAGQSVEQVQSTIERSLEGKVAIQPQVLVSIIRPVSISVTVTGQVTTGARIPLSVEGDRLLAVIAAAEGIRAPVNETFIQLSRGSRTLRVAMSRVVRDSSQNICMRPNDVLTLVREPQTFVVYGAAGRNAEALCDPANLIRALESRQGLRICCPEEVALERGFVSRQTLKRG